MSEKKTIAIIGAGPAGLAAAYSLTKLEDFEVILIEQDSQVGGLAKTINHNGYLMDIGPHRFFSKSQRVNDLWKEVLSSQEDFLKVKRLTRIIYLKKFFYYPINLDFHTFKNLGVVRVISIILSYIKIRLKPIKKEASLKDFYINRFGIKLYNTFFKDYTEKVWGVACENIPPDWGAQRVKSVSLTELLKTFIADILGRNKRPRATSLINEFYYPKYGAGQMYESMAKKIKAANGTILLNYKVNSFNFQNNKIDSITIENTTDHETKILKADYFISSMPIKELVDNFKTKVPDDILEISKNLIYRDYIIVGLLFEKALINNKEIPDNWLYIQEKDVKMGRLDIFKNFSPFLLKDQSLAWVGGEYFCNEDDDFYRQNDEDLRDFAIKELNKIGFSASAPLDFKVLRVKKAYPSYFGAYQNFDKLQNYLNTINNLYVIGRNGMHRYNNMDHSILTGLIAADKIINNITTKNEIWEVNLSEDYHEDK